MREAVCNGALAIFSLRGFISKLLERPRSLYHCVGQTCISSVFFLFFFFWFADTFFQRLLDVWEFYVFWYVLYLAKVFLKSQGLLFSVCFYCVGLLARASSRWALACVRVLLPWRIHSICFNLVSKHPTDFVYFVIRWNRICIEWLN